MLPWLFAYNRTKYARYLPIYLSDMLQLEEKHPGAFKAISAGEFVVQRSSSNGFAQVAADQTIEQGGIIGFSVNKTAVQRWVLTSHERAEILKTCREMEGSTGVYQVEPVEDIPPTAAWVDKKGILGCF